MTFNTTWNPKKYKYEYEMENHWKLKERFIAAHKGKFSEDELICLAQTFYNVEVMGCTYDGELMKQIEKLSVGLTDKRLRGSEEAYVDASSAISEKVKARLNRGESSSSSSSSSTPKKPSQNQNYISFVKAGASFKEGGTFEEPKPRSNPPPPPEEVYVIEDDDDVEEVFSEPKCTLEFKFSDCKDSKSQIPDLEVLMGKGEKRSNKAAGLPDHSSKRPHKEETIHSRRPKESKFVEAEKSYRGYSSVKPLGYTASQVMDSGPFGKVVLFESMDKPNIPVCVLQRASEACRLHTDFNYRNVDGKMQCRMSMNGIFLANGEGHNQKSAKEAACAIALERLKETSFTVQIKTPFHSSNKVSRQVTLDKGSKEFGIDVPLGQDNIGMKLMKLMGWSGGGLGKDEQGMEEPIKPSDTSVTRSGLGIQNMWDFKRKVITLIEDFVRSSKKEDLVFSPDFTKDERKVIHDLVRKYNLKSRSYGKDEESRHIVIFKRVTPREIVEDLIKCGGETEKYLLIPPTSIIP